MGSRPARRAAAGAGPFLAVVLALSVWPPPAAADPSPTPTPSPATSGPDLELLVSSSASGLLPKGGRVSYSVVARNVGDARATSVVIAQRLPVGVRVLSTTAPEGGACDLSSTIDSQGHGSTVALCRLPSLDPGGSVHIALRAVVRLDAACAPIVDHASVSSPDEPAAMVDAGNRAEVSDPVACACGLSLIVETAPASAAPGSRVVTRFSVVNSGDRVRQVAVSDGRLGHVATFAWVPPGGTRTASLPWRVPRSPTSIVVPSSAHGVLDDGTTCAARTRRTFSAASGSEASGAAGTPFTGQSAAPLVAIAVLLLLGGAALWITRRRR